MRSEVLKAANELRKIWSGFRQARVLITANNYRIFDHLSKQRSVRVLSHKLKTRRYPVEKLVRA